jgi:hypothetical protein
MKKFIIFILVVFLVSCGENNEPQRVSEFHDCDNSEEILRVKSQIDSLSQTFEVTNPQAVETRSLRSWFQEA